MRFSSAARSALGSPRCLFRRAAALGVCFSFAAALTGSAGDILRGGAGAGSRPGASGGRTNGAGTAPVRQNAKDALVRTTQALQAVKQMQAAARQAAIKNGSNNLGMNPNNPSQRLPNVPNGLGIGGLQVADGVPANLASPQAGENADLWKGAKLPTQKDANGRTTVTIEQLVQQALLNWKTFNIGKNTTLQFDQSRGGKDAGKWIAFNKVNDPSGVPSQILGSIKAQGQVYVINQNGIIFGGSSQVNVHGLVASSLPINDNLLQRGLLNNPDSQFLFSSLAIPALSSGATMPAFTPPPAPNTPDGKPGDVIVQPGATLTAPTTQDHVGGRIALVGPNVKNGGTISTPDGQTILAAGQQVGFRAHASSDATLRGLDVFVGAAGTGTGSATNTGMISVPRANATITGKEVNQLGAIDSSTSVSLNGRVDLLANYNATVVVFNSKPLISSTATGNVTLGPDSTISILPETFSDETVVGTRLALNSQVNIQGRTIHLATDSSLLAPGADVTMRAGTWKGPVNGLYTLVSDQGQIYLDAGAMINVAGSIDVPASITQNILSLQLLGSELADSPLQRTGTLRGLQLLIDIRKSGSFNGLSWMGTPLGDASGFAGLVQRNVAQLTTAGGTVKLTAGTSIVTQAGSIIDVSGGWTDYDGGMIQTTRVTSGNQIFDISQATPNRIYDGIYTGQSVITNAAWNITRTFQQPLALTGQHYEAGYTQGANGGSITITAPSVALDGALRGNTIPGVRQRSATPTASALSIIFQSQNGTSSPYLPISPTPPEVIFGSMVLAPVAPFALDANGAPLPLSAERLATVVLSPDLLTTAGFGSLTIDNSDGNISVPAGITLATEPGGTIKLLAANLNIAGHIAAPGGTLSLSTFNISPYLVAALKLSANPTTPPVNPDRGMLTLASGATLSTAGLVVDDRPGSAQAGILPLAPNGGTITISSYAANLQDGSSLDVSGGVIAGNDGKLTYGSAGSISLKVGQDPNVASIFGGEFHLGAALTGYSGSTPGALTLQAPLIQIGGTTTNAHTLLLDPAFFSRGGFGTFSLTGLGMTGDQPDEVLPGVLVAPRTVLEPVVKNWLVLPRVVGGDLELIPFVRPEGLRTPASLSLNASGVRDEFTRQLIVRGDLVIGSGALIQTDPRGSVTISGDTAEILGSILAPSGRITISGGTSFAALAPAPTALTTVFIGSRSVLSTAGTTLLTPDVRGFRTGTVLPGGSISVSGNIVASRGALLDVSGTSGELDVHPNLLASNVSSEFIGIPTTSGLTSPLWNFGLAAPVRIDSDGGSITLKGGQQLFTDATLRGAAGGPGGLGGQLAISSGIFVPPGSSSPLTPLDPNLIISQSSNTIPVAFTGSAIGKSVLDSNGAVVAGRGYFAMDRFTAGGFGALTLKGSVKFNGPVTINAQRSLSIADGGVIIADSAVNLTAPYVALGTAFLPPLLREQQTAPFLVDGQVFNFSPTYGPGRLTVHAQLIDIGNLSLQNIGRLNLIADGGDIRGDGTLNVAGDIYLRAGQIYPPTAVSFTISASDYMKDSILQSGTVTIAGSGTRSLPYSAGGTLNVYASTINQNGVLRAPLGAINIGWDGTGTAPVNAITGQAVASAETLTMGRNSLTSVSAIEPVGGKALVIPYGIDLNGISWIDPSGLDITAGGVPGKKISISAGSIQNLEGSVIDIRGGGDLYAYRWVKGLGGNRDILASTGSFAVIPGYSAAYAPYAPFNPNTSTTLAGDPGYVNSTLAVGDQIYLGGGGGLAAGYYTLLPARYALLPGAYLVTPKSGRTLGTLKLVDDSWLVSGYRVNGANPNQTVLASRFEIVSGSDVRDRAQYDDFLGSATLREGALSLGQIPPRLPGDAGQLVIQASTGLTLQGSVKAQGVAGSRGGLVDIASPVDIVIGKGSSSAGQLVLDSGELSRFGAESLLIGGTRQLGTNGTTVTVKTGSITVDNAGAPLRAPEVILVANQDITLETGASIQQKGSLAGGADDLLLKGDGVLVRVSADASAQISRTNLTGSTTPSLTVGANVQISGTSVTLDSTAGMTIDSSAKLLADVIALNSGRISIQLNNPGALQPGSGLVLAGDLLSTLQTSRSLSLLSYSSIDIYGTGSFGTQGKLALSAGGIRGFNLDGGIVAISAPNIVLENRANVAAPAVVAPMDGTINFTGDTIILGSNKLRIDQFATVELDATGGILGRGTGGLTVQGALTATAPVITLAKQANQQIIAGGALTLANGGTAQVVGGLGASLLLQGSSVTAATDILLPSGQLTVRATTGDLNVTGRLDAGGTAQNFFDLVKYTDAGKITLTADAGSVILGQGSKVNVAAATGGGRAGTLSISAANGTATLGGEIHGEGGGSFLLDTGSLANFGALSTALTTGGFTQAQTIRVRTGNVLIDAAAKAHTFNLSADQGTITVSSLIDASGSTGGSISLAANGDVVLLAGANLNVRGTNFNNAGKGGEVTLETRSGTLDIQSGSTIDLRVDETARLGDFSGSLHLRAPQINGNTEVAINAIKGSVLGASRILVEGYQVFDLTGSGVINDGVKQAVFDNGTLFGGNAAAIAARLLADNSSLASQLVVTAGAELINRTGNLTLGAQNSTSADDWNLATYRFGPKNAAGVLTLRASGDIVLFNAISDGFVTSAYDSLLLAQNTLLPTNAQSYSYRFAAGSDFTAVDISRVGTTGSLKLGKDAGNAIIPPFGSNAQTRDAINNRFQVIRTGTGDISIFAGRDVQLLNQFATIYTAGTPVLDPTMGGTFDLPILNANGGQGTLGSVQQSPGYAAQYTLAGGNINITAGNDIAHLTKNTAGQLVADSVRELPINWLYRRGYVDPLSGQFGAARFGDRASTTWWVDFSNFFEGVGALGGGNVTLTAGHDVANVDAVAPTNARMPKGTPNANAMVELGGGDVTINAGHDIDGGVYYVERGRGMLTAGNSIHTNSTRSPSLNNLTGEAPYASETWLPTTLFLGKGSFDVSALGDVTLGPVANPFLLPGGYNNTFWYKTYFSTYATSDSVSVASLGGNVTLRQTTTLPTQGQGGSIPMLQAWLQNVLLFDVQNPTGSTASFYQPWLRLNESSVTPFTTAVSLMPATLKATAFSGDINLIGNLTLSPSPTGTVDLLAAGAVNGLQIAGQTTINGVVTKSWGTSRINLSDTSPDFILGITTPLAYQSIAGTVVANARETGLEFLRGFDALFAESGATQGASAVLQTKQALHAPGVLHTGDLDPVHLYAGTGDISGVSLFSGKAARIIAGRDVSDIALYVQNVGADDVTLVTAGRDILAYTDNSPLRVLARSAGNSLNLGAGALAGDIQISGPGTLEVLAGRNLDLGVAPGAADGTGLGITSIGNARNPYLLFDGAQIFAGAGIGLANGLADSNLDIKGFIDEALTTDLVDKYLKELNVPGVTSSNIDQLPREQQAILAMRMFYLVLRDAGRDDPAAEKGYAAIDALFPGLTGPGNISLTAREIKTRNGGDIHIFAPGGGLTVGFDISGSQPLDQGILTEAGGNISIFTHDDVVVGTSRIFTLRGGNEIIWSSEGDIAAGSSAKTVQSAPPTRVLIDPQSGDVQTDLAGLATGGGIGVLVTVADVPAGDVDLIAPKGTVDAGDAGIRVSGNLNIAASVVLNAGNISAGGTSTGTPAAAPSAPAPVSAPSSNSTAAANSAASEQAAAQRREETSTTEELPSLVTVEVIGYGGGEGPADGAEAASPSAAPSGATSTSSEDEEEKRRRRQEEQSAVAPPPQ